MTYLEINYKKISRLKNRFCNFEIKSIEIECEDTVYQITDKEVIPVSNVALPLHLSIEYTNGITDNYEFEIEYNGAENYKLWFQPSSKMMHLEVYYLNPKTRMYFIGLLIGTFITAGLLLPFFAAFTTYGPQKFNENELYEKYSKELFSVRAKPNAKISDN